MPEDLLYEIGVEEMPANAVEPALEQLEGALVGGLQRLRLEHGEITTYGTPRRLAVLVRAVADGQPDVTSDYKGPPADKAYDAEGKPTKAAEGFAKSRGVAVEALEVRDTEKGRFVFATVVETGQPAGEVLPGLLAEVTANLTFPITLRWGEGDFRFTRPLRWLVALLGSEVVPVEVAGVQADRITRGHRAMGQAEIELASPDEYLEKLEANGVVADYRRRREMITDAANEAATQAGGTARLDAELLDENNFLVEWPVAVLGQFDEKYLKLPAEVIVKVMQGHQKYFAVEDEAGQLLPAFIAICNNAPENMDLIREGNEKVVAPRLADVEFYFEEDMKTPFTERIERLAGITFMEGMGTLADKSRRLRQLVRDIGRQLEQVSEEDISVAERAAELCKCDQTTMMIGDTKLGELQGIIGGHYARLSGEPEEVAQAIAEHYRPTGPGDELPATVAGLLLSIADKLDNLAACYRLGETPTGAGDPYALRRQAQAVLELLRAANYHLNLDGLINAAISLLSEPELSGKAAERVLTPEAAAEALRELFAQRAEAWLEDQGVSYDVARAGLGAAWSDVLDAIARAEFLARLRETDKEAFDTLVTAGERPARITRPEGIPADAQFDTELFEHETEWALLEAFREADKQVSAALDDRAPDYQAAAKALCGLSEPIHTYFEDVMVMVEDERLRNNRLAFLAQIDELFLRLADFLEIVQPGTEQ